MMRRRRRGGARRRRLVHDEEEVQSTAVVLGVRGVKAVRWTAVGTCFVYLLLFIVLLLCETGNCELHCPSWDK